MKKKFLYIIFFIALVFSVFKFKLNTIDLSDNIENKFTLVNTVSKSDYNKILVYKNNYNYPVNIKTSDIKLDCIGSGENKELDEKLVKSNMKINVSFSNKKDVLKVNSGDIVKISIDELYTGESLPNHSVTCNYNIEINMSGV